MKDKNMQPSTGAPAVVVAAVIHLVRTAEVAARHTRLQIATAAMNTGKGIFRGCHDDCGEPLDAASCSAIEAYLADPSPARWCATGAISVAGGDLTLGEWWNRVARLQPSAAPFRHPTERDLRRLIEVSIAENLAAAKAGVEALALQQATSIAKELDR